ncbi:hypothetical protein ACFW1A_32995 [Kitasatospora sp. NPDC058965]|uniref:hypothetical protein n=1 Tax=Kitasatospora sp. NPDC058965 TaxID=3346682 RepID=UPI0036A43D3F
MPHRPRLSCPDRTGSARPAHSRRTWNRPLNPAPLMTLRNVVKGPRRHHLRLPH